MLLKKVEEDGSELFKKEEKVTQIAFKLLIQGQSLFSFSGKVMSIFSQTHSVMVVSSRIIGIKMA